MENCLVSNGLLAGYMLWRQAIHMTCYVFSEYCRVLSRTHARSSFMGSSSKSSQEVYLGGCRKITQEFGHIERHSQGTNAI